MATASPRSAPSLRRRFKAVGDAIVGNIAVALLKLTRLIDRKRMADLFAWLMRRIGPWLPEHRIGRANLIAAYPEKSSEEIEQILAGVWDNLGRVAAEFAHIDRIRIQGPDQAAESAEVIYDPISIERFRAAQQTGKPAIFFAAHIANWEIMALAPPLFGIDSYVLYRRPNLTAISDAIVNMRSGCMGHMIASGLDAPVRLTRALAQGGWAGMLVDQHHDRGVDVNFFGRRCKANPLLAHIAKHVDCTLYGVHLVRLPDPHRFWGEVSPPIEVPRDAAGKVDVQACMQTVTSMVEGWVRAHPEQWLWLHRRWR